MNACEELILDDVISIDFYDADDVSSVSIPFNVPYRLSTEAAHTPQEGVTFTLKANRSAALSLSVDGDGLLMQPWPKVQTTEKREPAGVIRTHIIEAAVSEGLETLRNAVDKLVYSDLYAVLTTYDGTRYLCNAFANASTLELIDSRQREHAHTVKYTAQSYSGFIRIKETVNNG